MIRGTDQQFKFVTPYMCDEVKTVQITFWQPKNNNYTIVKQLADCKYTQGQKVFYTTLDQIETLGFSAKYKAYVQFRGLTTDDVAFSSRVTPITVYPTINDQVLE